MKSLKLIILFVTACLVFSYCKKPASGDAEVLPAAYQLSYGDSIIYLKNQTADHIVMPSHAARGRYSAYPEGLELDEETGAINVSESETGLRYRVSFKSQNGQTFTTHLVLAGINYLDRYYNLSLGDSIARPVYNASWNRSLPGGSFDEGNASFLGSAIHASDGQINLARAVRNGFFGATPKNDEQKEIDIYYRVNDDSKNALQKIEVILYYYKSMKEVPDYLKEIVQARENMIFGLNPTPVIIEEGKFTDAALAARVFNLARKPRPPCVVVLAQ